jgi:mono/diheme cytochrome c family protein
VSSVRAGPTPSRRSPVHNPSWIPGTTPVARSVLWVASLLATAACGQADEAVTRLGAQVYRAQCAPCHGDAMQGGVDWKRPGADGRLPPPPHDSTGHTWHHADGLLFRIVAGGTAVALGDTAHASRYGMPAFETRLTPEEIRAVLAYLKTTWTPEQRTRQAEASRKDPFPAVAGRP